MKVLGDQGLGNWALDIGVFGYCVLGCLGTGVLLDWLIGGWGMGDGAIEGLEYLVIWGWGNF